MTMFPFVSQTLPTIIPDTLDRGERLGLEEHMGTGYGDVAHLSSTHP